MAAAVCTNQCIEMGLEIVYTILQRMFFYGPDFVSNDLFKVLQCSEACPKDYVLQIISQKKSDWFR